MPTMLEQPTIGKLGNPSSASLSNPHCRQTHVGPTPENAHREREMWQEREAVVQPPIKNYN